MQFKILLIDDDCDDRTFFADAVKNIADDKVTCITLDDGHDLMATLTQEGSKRPSIIFTDINMPRMSGWEILALLKEHDTYKDIPVVMYSTSKHIEEITRAKSLGALCFFNKPSDFNELQNAIDEVVVHLKGDTIDSLCKNSAYFS